MSGSLSGYQMSPAVWGAGGQKTVGYDVGDEDITSGRMYQPWTGGETESSLRAGAFSTAGKRMSWQLQKGKTPLPASKQTLGGYLFTAEEAAEIPQAKSPWSSRED